MIRIVGPSNQPITAETEKLGYKHNTSHPHTGMVKHGVKKNMGIAAHDDQFLARWLRTTQATSTSTLGQELQRLIDDVQSAITALTTTVSGPGTQVGHAGDTQSSVMSENGVSGLLSVGSETESRRRRIVELRAELRKIRAQQEQLRTLGREHETLSESTNSNSEQTGYSGEVGFAR